MVGLVVVSHSRALARAAVALALEMVAGEPLRVEVAAGLDDDTFGTDAVAVAEAMSAADDGDGVVVLTDLGSAVLSAQLALDLLEDDDLRDRVVLSPGPLVEGLVVAAVTAASGAPRERVAAETAAALLPKARQVGVDEDEAVGAPPAPPAVPARESAVGTFVAPPPHGLHARPAAALLQTVGELGVDVSLRNLTRGIGPVPADSLTRVSTLRAVAGDTVEVAATGEGASGAVQRVLALADAGFVRAERPAPQRPAATAVGGRQPVAAAPGVGVGPAQVVRRTPVTPDQVADGGPGLDAAVSSVAARLEALADRLEPRAGEEVAAILRAQAQLAADPALVDEARSASSAREVVDRYAAAVDAACAQLAALDDAYLRARAGDVRDVGQAVLRELAALPPAEVALVAGQRWVVVAEDLAVADVAALDADLVAGIVLAAGEPTAHPAIVTRALGIPLVLQAGPGVLGLVDGTLLALDGARGELVVDPSPAVVTAMTGRHPRARVE